MQRDVVRAGMMGGHPALFSNAYSIDLKSHSRAIIVAGQVAVDGQGQVVGRGDFTAQCQQVFGNLQKVLEAAGGTMANVVSLRTYLTRAEDWPRFHEWRRQAYPRIFPSGEYPPNTAVVVTGLVHPDLLLEIEAMALM